MKTGIYATPAVKGLMVRELVGYDSRYGVRLYVSDVNLFTTMHDGNFRRHSSMNVTIK